MTRLEEAAAGAMGLLSEGRFDEAEQAIKRVDGDVYGDATIAKMYRAHLAKLVEAGITAESKARIEEVYRRALSWALRAYPEPHTAMEASNYDAGRQSDRAALLKILGYDPGLE